MVKKKNKIRVKWKNVFKVLAIILFLILIIYIGTQVFSFRSDNKNTEKMIQTLQDKIKITNVVDNENTTVIDPSEGISKFDSYWNYIKLGFIEADMDELKKINSDSAGWIELKGTDINYPVLKYSDNEFYKNHSFDKKENRNGWIYLDSKNNLEKLDNNTVIYGNKSYFKILFGNLNTVFKEEWNSNDNNYVIKYATSDFTTLWQVVSVYKSKDAKHTKTVFENEEEYEKFLKTISDKSEINFNSKLNSNDKIITLTTNSDDENIVVQAKLLKIKREIKEEPQE